MLEVLRSRPAVARPAPAGVRGGVRRAAGRRARLGGLERHRRAAPGGARGRHRGRRRGGHHARSASWPRPTASLYEGARPVFCDIDRRTLNIDPQAAAAAVRPSARAGLLPVHIFGYPADMPALERARRRARPVDRRGRLRGARRGARRRHAPWARAATWRCSPSTPNKQLDHRRGRRWWSARRAEPKERIDSERNQGRAPDMGWLDHDRLGFNYRLSDSPARSASRSSSASTSCSPRARASRRCTARRWPGIEGLELPCPDEGGDRRGWFVYVVQLPRGVDRDADDRGACARAGSTRSPTCPPST